MPLILEPESGFYSSPVLVFDFQSLYPSVMIAYNLCYSTCLGRIKEFMGTNRLGTASLAIQKGTLTLLKDHITSKCTSMHSCLTHWRSWSVLSRSIAQWHDVPQARYPPKPHLQDVNGDSGHPCHD